jgi:hypothetical protein
MKRHQEPAILAPRAFLSVALLALLVLAAPAAGAGRAEAAAAPTTAAPAAAAGASAPHGKAVAVEPIKDAGSVAKGDKVTQDFLIRNDGNAPLQITDVKASCGCTVVSFDKTIAPGKTGTVHVAVDTVTFTGPIAKGVTVFTDDPATPQIELTVRAKVEPYIVVTPGYARYVVVRGEPKEGNIVQTLYAPDGLPMDIVKVDSPFPFLTVSFREAQEGERTAGITVKQWRVEMLMSNDAPVGPLAGYVTVHTNHPKQKLVEIPISGFVRPVIAVTPPKADFGQIEVKEPLHRSLDVRNFATEPIRVTGLDPLGDGLKAELEPLQDGREYSVKLTVTTAMPKGAFHRKLTLHTDSPKSPVIEVDLSGTVL